MSSYIDNLKQALEEAKNPMITCFKCHGAGTYNVPSGETVWGEDGFYEKTEWKSRHCEVCHGTGKITLEFYEKLQKGRRR